MRYLRLPQFRAIIAAALLLTACAGPINLTPIARITVSEDSGLGELAWNPNGDMLAASNPLGSILLWRWDGSSLSSQEPLAVEDGEVHALAWHPAQARIAGSLRAGTCCNKLDMVTVWDVAAHTTTVVDRQPELYYGDVGWNQDGSRLAAVIDTSDRDDLRIWDTETFTEIGLFPGVGSLGAWSPDGGYVVQRSQDDSQPITCAARYGKTSADDVHIRDISTGEHVLSLALSPLTAFGSRAFSWSPDGTRLAAVDCDGSLRIWDAGSGVQTQLIAQENLSASESGLVWNPDSQLIAFGALQIRDANTGQNVSSLEPDLRWVDSLRWSRDGARLAGVVVHVDEPYEVWVWDVAAGKSWQIVRIRDGMDISWHPNGHLLAVRAGRSIQIWDTDDLP